MLLRDKQQAPERTGQFLSHPGPHQIAATFIFKFTIWDSFQVLTSTPPTRSAPVPKGMQKGKEKLLKCKRLCQDRRIWFCRGGAYIPEIRNNSKSTFTSSFYTRGSPFVWLLFKEPGSQQVNLKELTSCVTQTVLFTLLWQMSFSAILTAAFCAVIQKRSHAHLGPYFLHASWRDLFQV